MNIFIIIIKTLFIYLLVAFIFRIMGKREVGQLGTFDLVVFILIAELVAMAIENKTSFWINLVPVIILVVLQVLISHISLKNTKFRRFVDGKPVVIIKKGIINFKNMVDQRYTLDDLLLQLREKDIRSIDEVDYAILEINGKLSVFKKDDVDKKTYPLPIILDGEVQFDNLYILNKTKRWLLNILIEKKITAEEVFYAFSKGNELYIIKKSEISKKD
ncbi:MAG: DUF421 domain-containing protein [Candidatus Aphodocola sp.]